MDVSKLVLDEHGWDARYLWRVSALLVQLPAGSRLRVAEHPDEAWGTETQMLRILEYDIRALLSARKDGQPDPEPIPLPSEQLRAEERTRQAERDMEEVARALGMLQALGGD